MLFFFSVPVLRVLDPLVSVWFGFRLLLLPELTVILRIQSRQAGENAMTRTKDATVIVPQALPARRADRDRIFIIMVV
jgi:hypothetical protein